MLDPRPPPNLLNESSAVCVGPFMQADPEFSLKFRSEDAQRVLSSLATSTSGVALQVSLHQHLIPPLQGLAVDPILRYIRQATASMHCPSSIIISVSPTLANCGRRGAVAPRRKPTTCWCRRMQRPRPARVLAQPSAARPLQTAMMRLHPQGPTRGCRRLRVSLSQ